MKTAKRRSLFINCLLIFLVLFSSVAGFAAEHSADVVVSLQIGNPVMQINGQAVEIDAGKGTKPLVVNGRTLVPIRAIVEAFDGRVEWEAASRTVFLTLGENVIRLILDQNTAYLNDKAATLEAAPTIINERTMLPIRFIAESFHFGVGWDEKTSTVFLVTNGLDAQEADYLDSHVPPFAGAPYAEINGNIPLFKEYEKISGSFEYYSELDDFGRCDVCMASIAKDLMPTEKRESISSVTPSGWINQSYDGIEGKYLYNRCHLIGYQLTGENANERNLITGTRYLNIDGMLAFENRVDDYVEASGNHVMYRATPRFLGDNLVADGVLLEAYSVEDHGEGLSFCVYCYNVQPNITIDYATGNSSADGFTESTEAVVKIYRTPSGKKYHFDPDCGGKNSYEITAEEAERAGLTPCAKCCH